MLIDGVRVLSCVTLAAGVTGDVTTTQGIAADDAPFHPMQQSFLECDSYQCGYCSIDDLL